MLKNPVAIAIGLILLAALAFAAVLLQRAGGGAPQAPATSDVRVLRFGHNIPVDSALHQAALRFAELVAARSGGRLRVDIHPAQQLGTDDQMLEMAREGELDILLIPTAKISSAVPAMQYADLPFYFPSREALYAMLDGEPGQMLLGKLRAIDLVGVTFWENGFKHFTANHALRAPEDFAGLDVRIMKSRLLMEQFRAFGAHSIPIDFHATRQALADGVVDAQENPLVAIVSMGLHEVQSHLTLSSHGYMGYVFMISGKVFDGLSGDNQALLVEAARELTPWERAETHRREEALLATLRGAGVSIHTLSAEERARFAAATAHIPGRFEALIGADLLARTEELLDREHGAADDIVIALDADLSQECQASGMALRRGALLAIDEINAAGGVLGRPLKLIARNHQTLPSIGLKNIEDFARRDDVVAMIGGAHSAVAAAQAEFARRVTLPFVLPWASAAELTLADGTADPVFRVSANDAQVAPFLARHVLAIGNRPAIMYDNSLWGRSNAEHLATLLRAEGKDFIVAESFNRGEEVFDPVLSRIELAGADVLVVVGTPPESGRIVRSLAARDARVPVVSHWGITCGDFWEANREALARLDLRFFQTFSFIDNPRPAARRLGERYRQRYGLAGVREIRAPQAVAQAYDAVQLIARALERAGSAERAAVRAALERLGPYDGAVRHYAPAFTAARHDALTPTDYRMARFADDGAVVDLPR